MCNLKSIILYISFQSSSMIYGVSSLINNTNYLILIFLFNNYHSTFNMYNYNYKRIILPNWDKSVSRNIIYNKTEIILVSKQEALIS